MAKTSGSKKHPDPQKVFELAEAFRDAGMILMRQLLGDGGLLLCDASHGQKGVPTVVVAAFNLELYLKCLLCIEKGRAVYGHDPLKLFRELSPAMRKRVTGHYNAIVAKDPDIDRIKLFSPKGDLSIIGVLRRAVGMFDEFRYYYEWQFSTEKGYLADWVAVAARRVILELHPSWYKEGAQATSPRR